MAVASSTVGTGLALAGVLFFLVVVAIGAWVIGFQSRQFPKGWDRTGWEPPEGAAGRFLTMFTWMSGGRGGS